MRLKYFAYGSNMHPERFRQRVPSRKFVGLGMLNGYALRFHKRGRDGSGKCNACYTGCHSDTVIGVIYEMAAIDRTQLDLAEGLGCGYNLMVHRLSGGQSRHTVFFYQADPRYIDDTLKPFSWYKALVIGGCLAHDLPATYISRIALVQAVRDPDAERSENHLRLLRSSQSPSV